MQCVADDSVNRSIWTESVGLQRKIVVNEPSPLRVGAQQSMPKERDQKNFSSNDPLPWVPDLVGSKFGSEGQSVLVVASSYNGFIAGYSKRDAVMPLSDYVRGKQAGENGLTNFVSKFKECVVDPDENYYQPILRDLLQRAGCDLNFCCLTDLCKASFVGRGSEPDEDNRGDIGSDAVLKANWKKWTRYVVGMPDGRVDAPLPYQWLWQRMKQCRVIVALGMIAEYGVLKIFHQMATAPKAWSFMDSNIVPDHLTTTAHIADWECGYACSQRTLGKWLAQEDWWVLGDSTGEQRWFMLPVYHPSAAFGRDKRDFGYKNTAPRLKRVIEEMKKKAL